MDENITHRAVIILIAEDDDGHAELIREHLQDAGVHNQILRFFEWPGGVEFPLVRRARPSPG